MIRVGGSKSKSKSESSRSDEIESNARVYIALNGLHRGRTSMPREPRLSYGG